MRTSTYGRADLHVDVVAITDHDEIRGALRARDWARERPELGVDAVVGRRCALQAVAGLGPRRPRRAI